MSDIFATLYPHSEHPEWTHRLMGARKRLELRVGVVQTLNPGMRVCGVEGSNKDLSAVELAVYIDKGDTQGLKKHEVVEALPYPTEADYTNRKAE